MLSKNKTISNCSKRLGVLILIFSILLNSAIGLLVYFGYYNIYEKFEFKYNESYSLYSYKQNVDSLLVQYEFELPAEKDALSIAIELKEAVISTKTIQVFYLNEDIGQYNEENSITVSLPAGEAEVILNLPSETYTNLRIDIDISNEEFEIKDILISESSLTSVWIRNYVKDSIVLYFGVFINILLILLWFLARKKGYIAKANLYLEKRWNKIKKNHKKEYLENKSISILTDFINIFLFLFFLGLLISLCFFNNGSYVDMKGQLIMALIFFGVLFMLYKTLCSLRKLFVSAKVSFTSSLFLIFVCLFALQLYFVLNISTPISWDVGSVVTEAIAEPPVNSQYLSKYPNNLLLFFILRQIVSVFRLVGITDIWLGLSIVNTLLVDLSLFVSIIIIKKINSSYESQLILLILFTLLIGFSPWLIVPYSDTFSMPVVSMLVLFCILAMQTKTKTKRFIYTALCGLLFSIGWLLKSTIIAVGGAFLIALILYTLRVRKTVKIRRSLGYITVGIFSCVLTMVIFTYYVENQNTVIIDKTIGTPMSYSIATGLVEWPIEKTRMLYGAWNPETNTLNTGTTQEKNQAYYAFIKERLQDYGVAGYLKFLVNKARWITSEGNFFWPNEGYGGDFSNVDANILRTFVYNNGENYQFWRHAVNGIWIVVFLGFCLGLITPWLKAFKGRKFDADFFVRLNAFFIILVILFVEGRSRYLISFLPIFCIVSANGYCLFIKMMKGIYSQVNFGGTL